MTPVEIKNADGTTFRMRIVTQGDTHGARMQLTHDSPKPVIEFYDADHDFTRDPDGNPLGQLVSSYYLETLLADKPLRGGNTFGAGQGLNLDAGVPKWTLDAGAMSQAEIGLFEAGMIDRVSSPNLAFGYGAFRAGAPQRDQDPYLSFTPTGASADTAAGWAEVYCLRDDREALEAECMSEMEEFGFEEDEIDNVFAVIVTETGQMRVYHDHPRYLLAAHEAEDVLAAHGVEEPDDTMEPGV